MKRSKTVKLLLLGAASAFMLGCEEEKPQQASVFKDVGDCVTSKLMTEDQCKAAFDIAAQEHEKVAPKFDSRALCEQEFGVGQCSPKQSDSGSVFMPLMTGFMAAQLMNSINDSHRYDCRYNNSCASNVIVPQPLYRTTSDYSSYRTAGNYRVADVGSPTKTVSVKPSTVKPAVVTSTIKSSGGFGTQAAARASWGGSVSSGG